MLSHWVHALRHRATAAPPSSLSHVCYCMVLCYCASAHFHTCFPPYFFSFASLFFSFLHPFVSEFISSIHPQPPNVTAPPAAQDFGGVGFGEDLPFWQALPVILIPIKWEIFILGSDLQACLPPLLWILQVSVSPTDLHCRDKETYIGRWWTKLQGFLAAKPPLVRTIESQLSTLSLKGNYQNKLETASPNVISQLNTHTKRNSTLAIIACLEP